MALAGVPSLMIRRIALVRSRFRDLDGAFALGVEVRGLCRASRERSSAGLAVAGEAIARLPLLRLLSLSILLGLISACAMPGKLYPVAPTISGRVDGIDSIGGMESPRLRLVVMHRESPSLFEVQELPVDRDGRFSFPPVELVVAGHEISKVYRSFLYFEVEGDPESRERVIWRAEFSRTALAGPIDLDCDLDRSVRLGQPCRVKDGTRQPWLVATGESTFERLCARCHGNEGRGQVAIPGSKVVPAPDLTRIASRNGGKFDRTAVAEWIEGQSAPASHGTRTMPSWGERLTEQNRRYPNPEELAAATLDPVLVYLETLQR